MAETWTDSQRIQDAIQVAVNTEDDSRGVVTKFIAIAEVLDGDGKKLVAFRGPNSDAVPVWDVRGMLHDTLQRELFEDEED